MHMGIPICIRVLGESCHPVCVQGSPWWSQQSLYAYGDSLVTTCLHIGFVCIWGFRSPDPYVWIYAYEDPCSHTETSHLHTGIYCQTLLKIAKNLHLGIPVCILMLCAYGDQHIDQGPLKKAIGIIPSGKKQKMDVTKWLCIHPAIPFLNICASCQLQVSFRLSIIGQQLFRRGCHNANAILNDSISSPEVMLTLARGSWQKASRIRQMPNLN